MARGNDPDAARELQEKYGTSGNAEDLINANRGRRDALVRAASRLPIDEEASEKLKPSDVDHDGPGEVVDAKVRGRYVSYVYDDGTGRLLRGAHARKGLSASEKKQATADAGEGPVEEAVAAAHAEHALAMEQVRRDYDAKLEEAVAKAREEASKEAEKHLKETQKATSDAAAGK